MPSHQARPLRRLSMPNNIEALLHTACAHAEKGSYDTAASQLNTLLHLEPAHPAAMQLLGLVQVRQGDLRNAARTLRQACLAAPDHGQLHVHLARVEWEIGMPAQAVAAFQQAIALGCTAPDVLVDCAVALGKLQRHADAIDLCRRAVAQDPTHARGWQTQANLLHRMERLDDALACHDRALALTPDAIGWSGKALTLDALGRLEESLACHDQALKLSPEDASILTHCGVTLGRMQRHEEAVSCHARATELDPTHATAWSNLGASLCRVERLDAAIAAHDKAVSLFPASTAIWLQRGASLISAGRYPEALASCNAAIRLAPSSADAWRHRALALESQGHYEKALESIDEAYALKPGCMEVTLSRANLLFLLDRNAEALAWLEEAILRHPDDDVLRFCLGLEQLRHGEFAQGWANFQRHRTLRPTSCLVDEQIPVWSGADCLKGKSLLVHAEEGLGDVIQFCRLVPQLASMGCTVFFAVYPPLKQLLSSLDGCQVVTQGDLPPACDYRVPLMALPQFLLRSERDIPMKVPYLSAASEWPYNHPVQPGLKIGIACSGNPINKTNAQRSAPLARFERLQRHGILFILQNTLDQADAAWLQSHPSIQHPTAAFSDFADTAEVVDAMDLVISVDTSIAHLAGALGKPLWLLLPYASEWRWKERSSTTTPWYPSARLFRQTAQGQWDHVFCQLDQELERFSKHICLLQRGAA
jgi:tetratricopeptide (TPR) repeat protein